MPFNKRALQIAVALAGLVPVLAGTAGIVQGPAMAGDGTFPIDVESHFRYLSGLLLAIGLAFWSTIPGIERHREQFRLLTFIVVIGGLGRLAGIVQAGLPSAPMLGGLAMELLVTPLLCVWQSRLRRE